MRRIPFVLMMLIVLTVLLGLVMLCTFVQREYEEVLVYRFGEKANAATIAYNWKLCWPTDRIVRIDRRTHLYQSALLETNTAGAQPVAVQAFAAWRIENPELFYTRMGGSDETAQRFLDQKIVALMQARLAATPLQALFNVDPKEVKIDVIEASIREEANKQLQSEGMVVDQIGFARVAFPPAVAESVYSRMVEERVRQAAAYVAEGRAEATKIEAEGDAEKKRILGDARREAEAIRGAGEGEANAALASVVNTKDAREFYEFMRALDLFKATLTRNTYLVLPSDSQLLQYLFNPPTRSAPSSQPFGRPTP